MKKPARLKPQPLASDAEFFALIDEIARLEIKQRELEARRDGALAAVNTLWSEKIDPVAAELKGKVALAAVYAGENRKKLLDKDAKSVKRALAVFGWRTGNRTVSLMAQVKEEHAINALKALGLERLVRTKEEIARDVLLAECRNGKTVIVENTKTGRVRHVAIARAGLKIKQGESFYVEPTGATAETLKPEAAA